MPLTFDLPLEELSCYQGINPKPRDYDEYWSAALDEMRAVDPEIELAPAEFQAQGCECYHLYFTGVQGARVHAKLLKPQGAHSPHPAVLMFHGYTGSSGDWMDKLGYVAEGFTVAALDCRGQGGLSEDAGRTLGNTLHGHIIRGLDDALRGHPEKLLYRQIFLDTAQLAKIIMEMPDIDPGRVGATGYSQGGALTVACAALVPTLKRAAPVYPFLSDYRRVWSIDLTKDAYLELQEYFRMFDPLHQREDAVFDQLGYIDIQHLAKRIRADILWGIGLMDTVCPPSSQFAVYNKIPAAKRMAIFPDFGHENLPSMNDRIFQYLRCL